MDIPEKYRELVKSIAEDNDCGFICFINPATGEKEEAMPSWLEDPDFLESSTGEKWEEIYTFENWDHIIEIEPPESYESFKIMEDFTEFRVTGKVQQRLVNALSRPKPFGNFKNLVEQSEYRQEWFDYKQERLEDRAWRFLCNDMP